MRRAVVYAVDNTSRFRNMVCKSIESLRKNNPTIEIAIINTGETFDLSEHHGPIQEIRKRSRFGRFPDDKCLIGTLTEYDQVAFVDSDTLVLADIDHLFTMTDDWPIAARLSWTFQSTKWNELYDAKWRRNLERSGSPHVPVFNSGVIVFRDHSHVRIFDAWVQLIHQFHKGDLEPVYGGPRLFEQLSFAIAVGKCGIKYGLLDKNAHCYAWNGEQSEHTIVYHTTSKWYEKYASEAAIWLDAG